MQPGWRQYISRIAIRLMAFNLLLVLLPIAGVLYLDVYEDHLVAAQERAMFEKAEVVAAALEVMGEPEANLRHDLIAKLSSGSDLRVRVLRPDGTVVADSGTAGRSGEDGSAARRSLLYRIGSFLLREPLRLIRPSGEVLAGADEYERAPVLRGGEVRDALAGQHGSAKRIASTTSTAVVLYAAVPVEMAGSITGVVLVSQSTLGILNDLYAVRLGIFQIFLVGLLVAAVISLWIAATIVRPIRQLREEAGAILDRRGRLRGGFRGSTKQDEIGDLSRALERLTSRLDAHQQFSESFASDVSHEFKNPLASIRNATEMLSEAHQGSERRRFLGIVEREVARMEHLLSALRDVTLIDARIGTEERTPVDIDGLIVSIVEGFNLRRDRDVSFVVRSSGEDATVLASGERLVQVFENLLDNAASFSPEGGTVEIALAREGGSIEVLIADRGPGFPEGHHERIFDRFFTYRPGENGREIHTGLGLAIVKAIVESYGGTVRLRNREGGGAVAEVRLPAA